MEIYLTDSEIKWIKTKYPNLKFKKNEKIIRGILNFERENNSVIISDSFNIEIFLISKPSSILPQVKEIGGKIKNIANKLGKGISDLHINDDGTSCLTIFEEEKNFFTNGFNIQEFFINILEPYFYWISYYEQFGKPPWGEYAHGELGYLELYGEGKIDLEKLKIIFPISKLMSLKNIQRQNKCICNSNLPIRNCHKLIYYAISRLKKEL